MKIKHVGKRKSLEDLEIKLIGGNDIEVIRAIDSNGITSKTKFIQYLSRNDVLKHIVAARLLLLPVNDTPDAMGRIPGKLFEYLAAKRPILCIGPKEGDSARVISETNSGITCEFLEIFY